MGKRAANLVVKPRKNESPERLIRRFNRKAKKAGIVQKYKNRQRYKKPSEVRKEKISKRLKERQKQKR
jgi:ribosomal protein S21